MVQLSAMIRCCLLSVCLFCALLCAAQNGSPPDDLLKKAQAGDSQAQFELGQAYYDGKGVPQDDEAAARWYRKSADQGNAKAQNTLGTMYSTGRGVPRDKVEAFGWYHKAALQSLPEAEFNVAISYYNGDGVGLDLDRAYAWAVIAKKHGSSNAEDVLQRVTNELHDRTGQGEKILAQMYERGNETPADLKAAFDIYLKLSHEGRGRPTLLAAESELKVCQFYGVGMGVPQDLRQAREWCRKAAKDRNPKAFMILGRMAENGDGTEKNLKEAAVWYKDAALSGIPDGYMQLARLKLQSGSHADQREAYFWFYIAQFADAPGAPDEVRKAAANLSVEERAEEQRRAQKWMHSNPYQVEKLTFP